MTDPSQRTTNLTDRWANVTNNELARALLLRLNWPSLRPMSGTPDYCLPCKSLDFQTQLPELDLQRNIEELERGSKGCSLCNLFFQCLSNANEKPRGSVKLFWNESFHALQPTQEGRPIISIYSDPGSWPLTHINIFTYFRRLNQCRISE